MNNYFKQMMIEGYELLASDKVVWPEELADSQKIRLLQQAVKYFETIEEYQKCAVLREKIDSFFIITKKKPRKRRPK